jgi:hypothetical protein
MIASGPPPRPPPERLPWPFGNFPRVERRTFVIIGSLVAVAVIVGAVLAIISAQQGERTTISEFAPKVNFITFEAEKQEIRVGESTSILYNVQNSEDRVIDDARVVLIVEPEAGQTYLSISNRTVDLPVLNKDGRTGEIKVTITATGTPATEAIYVVKGILSAEGTKTDAREFDLTVRQQQ